MISVAIDTAKWRKLAERIGADMLPTLAATVLRGAHTVASIISSVVMERAAGGTSQLARSFIANVGFVQRTKDEVSARTWSPLPYARIQDEGGTILPRTAKALAIPVTPEAKKMWPRDWPGDRLFMVVLRGKALLAERLGSGKGAKLKVHYVLKPSVTLDGKGYMAEANKRARPAVDQMMRDAMQSMVARAGNA